MEPKICTKMFRNLSEKLTAKFPATTLSYSMVKMACLNDDFSAIFKLESSRVKGRSLQQKDKKRSRRKDEKKKKRKLEEA